MDNFALESRALNFLHSHSGFKHILHNIFLKLCKKKNELIYM